MPMYRFQCESCKDVVEVFRVMDECSKLPDGCKCGSPKFVRMYSIPPAMHVFPTDVDWDTMDEHPPKITSKRQLKEECRKRGLTSRYLEDAC